MMNTLYIWLQVEPETNLLGEYRPIVYASALAKAGEVLLQLDNLAKRDQKRCFDLISEDDFCLLEGWIHHDRITTGRYAEIEAENSSYRYIFTRFITFCQWKKEGFVQVKKDYVKL